MRRLALLASLLAAVAITGTASGSLDRSPRDVIEQALLDVRPAPDVSGHAKNAGNRVRVIVTLDDPPLAAATFARRLPGFGADAKLNFSSSFSRSYLGGLESAQAKAIASIREEVPEAIVSRRYQVLVNGFAVSVPYERLPDLLEVEVANRVYPSYSYTLNLNRGPSVLGAPAFSGLTGARGDGVKVAVVDDGVDHEHEFLDPTGFSYPAGYPKGTSGSTTPKVIVARGFAGPGASSTPLDRDNSFHGTHVAGVIAGVKTDVEAGRPGICVEAQGGCHPAVDDLEGVAPRAYIGNYRVFNVPAPAPLGGCCSANSPEIVAAFEAAVRDGMDVINFSGGGPQADPRTDVLIQAVANIVRAGVVPIISAGNDRDFFGLGTAGSPATAPDAISVGAVANAHVFGPSITVRAPGGVGRIPFGPADNVPPSWISTDQRLVDVGTIGGANRQLCDGSLRCGLAAELDRARESRRLSVQREGGSRARGRRRGHGRRREPPWRPELRSLLRTPGRDHLRPRRVADPRRGRRERWRSDRPVLARDQRGADDLGRRADELLGRRSDAVRARAEARRHGAGRADPLVHASRVRRRPVRDPRRDQLLRAAHRGRRGPPDPAAPVLDAGADEVGAHVDGGSCVRRHVAHAGGVGHRPGRRAGPRVHGRQAADLLRPAVPLLRIPRRRRGRELDDDPRDDLRRRRRRRHVDGRDSAPGRVGRRDCRGSAGHDRAGRQRGDADLRPRLRRGGAGRQLRLRPAEAWRRRAAYPVRVQGLALVAHGRACDGAQDPAVAATRAPARTARASTAGRRRRSRSSASSASIRR